MIFKKPNEIMLNQKMQVLGGGLPDFCEAKSVSPKFSAFSLIWFWNRT